MKPKTDIEVLNKDKANINNLLTNKMYAKVLPGFSFEEYVVVSSSNQIFQASKTEKRAKKEQNVVDVAGMAKSYLANLYKRARLIKGSAKGEYIKSRLDLKKVARTYIKRLNENAVSKVNAMLEQSAQEARLDVLVPRKGRYGTNSVCIAGHVNIMPTTSHLRVQSTSTASILETISKDLLKIRERIEQFQTDKSIEATIAQFKQNYVLFPLLPPLKVYNCRTIRSL